MHPSARRSLVGEVVIDEGSSAWLLHVFVSGRAPALPASYQPILWIDKLIHSHACGRE